MASSYTSLGTELMTTGENAGTWGTTTNTNLQILEQISGGYTEQDIAGSADTTTLSVSDGSTGAVLGHRVIKFTGTITGNQIVTIPLDVQQMYVLVNGTSGAYTVQFKYASGSGSSVTFAATDKGTKLVYAAADHATNPNLVDSGIASTAGHDLDGNELILDADADTSITADTDDQIDIKIAGADDFQFTANTFTAQAGSTIAAQALTATTVTASGIVKTDDTTEATSTTDGSLQTDGGLSVAKDAVIGDDLKLLSDSAVLSFGADSDTTLTHTDGTGLTLNSTNKLLFRDTGLYINSSTDGQLDLVADTEIQIAATTIDINGAVAMDGAITGATNITLSGELDAATLDISGNADIDGTTNLDAVDIDGAVQVDATITVGADDQGYDVKFFGDTASAYMLWDTSADDLVLAGAAGIDLAGDIDVDGTANLDAVDIDGAVQIDGAVTVGVDGTGLDVKFFGDTSGSFMLWDQSDDALELTDSSPIKIGDGGDMQIYHDGSNSYVTNSQGALKLATETSGIAITLGHSTSEVTVADNLTVTGDLTVNGTTTTVNSTTVTIDDPIFTLGGDTAPGSDDNKDRGIEFRYHDGSSARIGFFGYDDSATGFTFLTAATNSSEVFSGTAAKIIAGELDISGNMDIDGTSNLDAVDIDGAVQIDSTVTVGVNDTGYDVKFFGATSGAYMLWDESTDDLVLAGAAKLYLYDAAGGESLSSDGTDLTINAGTDLNLTAGTDINIPADVGLTFGNDAEKIEGDGTDLTISGNNINLTATADVNIPSGVGLTFATAEKIESDGTDLSITVGSNGDINIPADIGMTFGNDAEKIEGDGTDLTITGNNIKLTATADVVLAANTGLVLDGSGDEKIESDGTDISFSVGSNGDINIPQNVGVTFGDDGEKIEGDGTDLTISASALANIDAGTDIVLDADGGDIFFKDDGTTFGSATNTSGNLIIKSGTTTAATFSGANVTFAGTIAGGGTLTTGGNVVIPDAGNIGSASDTDAIAIASNGVVTFSQAPVFPDGSIAVADLDIDGATDINAALVDADLFIVDDGAGGTNRKVAASRLVTYIDANSSAATVGKAIAMAIVFG